MLMRHYIGRRLAEYYSQPSHRVVGAPPRPIDLARLWGEWHWKRAYRDAYEASAGQWLTPVELFRPHYSRVVANFVVAAASSSPSKANDGKGLHIVELGGGRGTNASVVLDTLRDAQPDAYDGVTYTIYDSSKTLHELQREVLLGGEHVEKIRLELQDLADVAEQSASFLEPSDVPTVMIALEVLDNLPHDKVRRSASTRALEQAVVHPPSDESSSLSEGFVPLSDPLLKQVVKDVSSYAAGPAPRWVPTIACGVLSRLFRSRPNAALLFADFDWLPPPDLDAEEQELRSSVAAEGDPLVTDMEGRDHVCPLTAPDLCDVLYPTDFQRLAAFVKKAVGPKKDVRVRKQSDFLLEYGQEEVDATRGHWLGYTPMVHDFGNCSVLTVS